MLYMILYLSRKIIKMYYNREKKVLLPPLDQTRAHKRLIIQNLLKMLYKYLSIPYIVMGSIYVTV